MKRMFVVLAVLGAVAAIVVPISAAANSNGASVTHFSAYTNAPVPDPIFGQVTNCTGDRIVKTAPKASIKDDENCTLQGVGMVGVYTSPGVWWGWNSDFGGMAASSFTITVTPNADGVTSNEHIVANY